MIRLESERVPKSAATTLEQCLKNSCESRNSVDGYSSNAACSPSGETSSPRSVSGDPSLGAPGTTRSIKELVDAEAPRRSASLIFFSGGLYGGGEKAGTSLIEEDVFQSNEYYDDTLTSKINPSSRRLPFSVAGPFQTLQGLASDVEAARNYVAMDEDGHGYREYESEKHMTSYVPPLPILIKFVDIRYKVVVKQQARWRRKPIHEKEILHGITGAAVPGELFALMGPSGSGKTTLLSILGGRIVGNSRLSGTLTYNDMPYDKNLKRRIGFVTQDDVLYPHLTVRETLTYAALLRLPASYTKQGKIKRADEVIEQLGLERCRDTIIGGSFLRGISGGERKRVCIGHEILIDPSVMLLDEPTSGLDSTTALRIIQLLQNIAQGGRTVVTTIHQPSSRLFHIFDRLVLLSEGHLVYSGKAMDAMNYFSSIELTPSIQMNPAEFLLDLCSGITNDISSLHLEQISFEERAEPMAKKHSYINGIQFKLPPNDIRKFLVDSCERHIVSKEREGLLELSVTDRLTTSMLDRREWTTTWWEQFAVLFGRGMKEHRHDYLGKLRSLQVVAVSVIAGCLWWQSDYNKDLQDQVGLLFFITTFWGFLPHFTAIFTFPLERAILAKERAADMYRLSAYFMARTLGEMPLELILPTASIIIIYFMAGLRMSTAPFLFTLFAVYLMVITSQGVGLLVGAALMDVKKATTLASVVIVTFMLVAGFFLEHIPRFIAWVKYISFQSYAFKLLIKIQYRPDQTYNCSTSGSACQRISSSTALHGTTLGGGGEEVWAIVVMIVGYRVLAYFALRKMKLAR